MSNIGIWEDAEPGVKRKILPAGQALMMMMVQFKLGAQGYEHTHPHEQMSYCLKGTFQYTIDGQTYQIHEGENINIPPGSKHGAKALEDGMLLDCFTPLREDLLKSN